MSSDTSPLATSTVSEQPQRATHHVLMLVNTHVYDDPRVIAEAESLVEAGYAVHIVGAARHGGLPVKDTVRGMDVLLTPMVSESHPLALLRVLWRWLRGDLGTTTETPRNPKTNLVSFLFFNLWALRAGLQFPAEVIHAHDLSPLPAAWLLARWRRARLIYDSHESAPDFYTGAKGRWVARLEKALIGKPEAVITVGERLARALRERGARRAEVIGNWKRVEDYCVDPARLEWVRQRLQLNGQHLVICHLGQLAAAVYDIEPLLEAVVASPKVSLLIAGRGDTRDQIIGTAARAPNIHWLDWVDMADVPLYTLLADVNYCCLNPTFSQAYYVAPNKLFEAFAAGKAVIARRGVGEIGEILEQTCAGVLLDDVTPETLKDAFRQLQNPDTLKRLQQNALAARERYHWGVAEERLRQLYAELTGG